MKENELIKFTRNAFCIKQKITENIGKEFSLPPIEVDILCCVYVCANKTTATKIERERNIKKNTISNHVESLVEKGYLTRQEHNDDRRVVNLVPTDKAKEIAKKYIKETNALKKKLFNGLQEEDIEKLQQIFSILNENAKQILKK